jgi:acyl-CoA synthetase (AMP-forming)/AMP-acid ligase II
MAPPSFSTLIDLIAGAREVPTGRGIRLVSSRFRETFHPYSEMHRRVLFHADHLRGQDINPGDRVIIPLTTDINVICSFLALIWLGAVPVSVSGQMAGQDRSAYLRHISFLLEKFQLERLLTDKTMAQMVAEDTQLDPRLTVDPYPPGLDPDRPAPSVPPARTREDDVAFIQFSSGSTGDPKGIQITHRNICTNLKVIVENDGRTEESSFINWLPLYHDMGLVGGFLTPWVYYHPLVLMHPVCFVMKPVSWLDYLSRYRGQISPVPNFAIDMCNTRIRDHQLESRKPDLGSVEYIYNGSEPVNADAIEGFYERFAPYGLRRGTVNPVYGMAEATLMVTAPPKRGELITREQDGVKVVSVGRAVGDFKIRIANESGKELPADSVGEILLRGSSLTPGYFENEEENERRFRDGWFHTGDLGMLDDEGRLFVTGRIKDLIIVNGKNYYAYDIATKVEELPFVRRGKTHVFSYNLAGREELIVMTVLDSAVTSALQSKLDEFKRFLSTAPGSWVLSSLGGRMEEFIQNLNPQDVSLLKDSVKQFLMKEFGLPAHDVFLVPRIPKTTSGKIRRGECEDLYRKHLQTENKNGD